MIFALILVATLSLATTALTEWIYNKLMQEGLVTYLHNIFGLFDVFGLFDPNYWNRVEQIPTSTSPWQWHLYVIYVTPNRLAIHLALTFLLIGCAMGIFVNVNKFSLHSAYRDRLIRAYLGASRSASDRRPIRSREWTNRIICRCTI